MDSSTAIRQFLDRVRRRRNGIGLFQGMLRFLALAGVGALAGNLIAYFASEPRPLLVPFLVIWAVVLGAGLLFPVAKALASKTPYHQTALWVESRVGNLNNSLISSVQLEPQISGTSAGSSGISGDMIRELAQRTHQQIRSLNVHELVSSAPLIRSGQWAVGVFAVALAAALLIPDFLTRGYQNWSRTPAPVQVGGASKAADPVPALPGQEIQYAISGLELTFNYPAYTGLKPVTRDSADGSIKVLPGTEVTVKGDVNLPVETASLVLNGRDNLSMMVENQTELTGRLIAKDPGFYQFRLKSPQGQKSLLEEKYPIDLTRDQAPKIILFLANPKPVYHLTDKIQFFYEGRDDFGIQKIDLVMDVEGKVERRTIKRIKGRQKDLKDGYTWELSTMNFQPGDRVHYFLEILDNDNVTGPNSGQSEVFSFDLFDAGKKRLDLLALQEELVDKMVALLAVNLVTDIPQIRNSPDGLAKLKMVLVSSSNQLIDIIGIAQSIESEAREIESFPKPYLTLLENMISGFNEIRQDQIEAMNRITQAMARATPIGLNFPPLESVHDRLTTELERDILFLIKIINRERMDQALNLNQTLTELTESLREEFRKARDKKGKAGTAQFKKALKKIRETLQQIMEQLARQNNGLSDEFLNPNAFENLNMESFSASLEKLMDLVNRGKIDEAMEELEKLADDFRAFSAQLDDLDNRQESMVDMQIMKKLNQALEKIETLEKNQKALLDKTAGLNQSLRSRQSEKFENQLEGFFADLRKDVRSVLTILHKDENLLEQHPDMKKLLDLMERQAQIQEEINDLNQKTLNSLGQSKHRGDFQKLNQARSELSANMEKQQALQMKMFHGFKVYLPELTGKYDKLEEFTELMDLFEFSTLFKNTYPEVFRWQNHFRTSRKLNPDLLDQMKVDLLTITQINSEISKKLGAMMGDLKENYQNLISEQDRQNLQAMSGQQKNLRGETEELSRMFSEMNRENPMLSPLLSHKMDGSGRHMKSAEGRLKSNLIPESIEAENRALQELSETKEMLNQLKEAGQRPRQGRQQTLLRLGQGQAPDNRRGGNTSRMQQEKVNLPTEDQYRVPGQFREDILKAMKNKYPKKYERLVGEYYKELVK